MTEFIRQSSHPAHRVAFLTLLAGTDAKVSKEVTDAGA